MSDSEIDLSDAPPVEALPSRVEVGRFYKTIRQLIGLREVQSQARARRVPRDAECS
jgi:hypothetical protein